MREVKNIHKYCECLQTITLQKEPTFPLLRYILFHRSVSELSPGLYYLQRSLLSHFQILVFKIYIPANFPTHLSAIHTKQGSTAEINPDPGAGQVANPAVHVQTAGTGVTAHDCSLCSTHSAQEENEIAGWLDT